MRGTLQRSSSPPLPGCHQRVLARRSVQAVQAVRAMHAVQAGPSPPRAAAVAGVEAGTLRARARQGP
jgi:hypothetical protein